MGAVALGTPLGGAALESETLGAAAGQSDAILFMRNAEPASDTRPPYRNPLGPRGGGVLRWFRGLSSCLGEFIRLL